MSVRRAVFLVFGLAWTAAFAGRSVAGADRVAPPFPSSEATAWIGAPQSLVALRGKVVLLDVWTFG